MGKEQYSEERLNKLGHQKFVRLLGVGRVIFNEMVKTVEREISEKHSHKKGRKPKYSAREIVIIDFLRYLMKGKNYKRNKLIKIEDRMYECDFYNVPIKS